MNENKYMYFIKIHELGSITKAAEILYISQPALSKYIRNLERELGVSLVEREYSPVRFTEAGEIYFRYAKEALKNYDKMPGHSRGRNKSLQDVHLRHIHRPDKIFHQGHREAGP